MAFELPDLPYELNALEPVLSKTTLEFHYGKHHQAYVNKLNDLVPGTEFENATLEEIIQRAEGPIFNNAAQIWNHTFYFYSFSPDHPKVVPHGDLADMIDRDFGSLEEFRTLFNQAAATLFGSGWVWLAVDENKKLEIVQSANAGNPLREGKKPLLTADVWEHAYYLDYQNRRPNYMDEFWKILDWQVIEERLVPDVIAL